MMTTHDRGRWVLRRGVVLGLVMGAVFAVMPVWVSAANILFIGEPDEPAMGDPFVIDHLEDLGHDVTFSFGLEISGEDVDGFDLLVMSSTNLTSNIRENGFETIPQPILTWESSMVRTIPGEFYLSGDQQSGDLGSVITVTDASHPIMAGLDVSDGDELEIFTEDQNFFGLTGEIAPGATLIAVGAEPCCDEERSMIVDLPAGAEVLPGSDFDGEVSPGHRVFLPISDTSFEFLNEAGLQIFNNALDHVLGAVNGLAGDFDGSGALDAPDIDDLTQRTASGLHDAAYDLNGDTLVDSADIGMWVKELFGSWIGDSNLDREFNSQDFVSVFTSGKYESGDSAVWTEGDWNGDGRFDSSDFVASFSDGGFELGPPPQANAVPEPSAALPLVVFGVSALFRRRRT